MTLTPSRPVPPATTAAQQRLEVELLLGEAVLSAEELAAAGAERWKLADFFSPDQCLELGCLPVGLEGNALVIAVPTQWTPQQRQQLLDLAAGAGLTLNLRLALQGEIEAELERPTHAGSTEATVQDDEADLASLSDVEEEDESQTTGAAELPLPSLVDDLQLGGPLEEVPEDDFSDIDVEKNLNAAGASPVVTLVDKVLVRALSRGASDIHMEPQEDGLLIRFRQDGVLEPLEKLPKNLIPAVTSRVKIIADLDIAERRLPQDGRIRRRYQGRLFDLRVSTLPTRYGEKVVMRLLDSGATHLGLDKLISDPKALEGVRD
ncbi:MAG: GspE/PulE family protein, partial [Cyanobium sp.]